MIKKDFLFELIKSLEKNEKRHFKLFASRHTVEQNNKYVKLFDAIDKQKEYNEVKIVRLFSNTAIAKNFRFNKHYLYKLIVKSLELYHSNIDKDAELRSCLHQNKLPRSRADEVLK